MGGMRMKKKISLVKLIIHMFVPRTMTRKQNCFKMLRWYSSERIYAFHNESGMRCHMDGLCTLLLTKVVSIPTMYIIIHFNRICWVTTLLFDKLFRIGFQDNNIRRLIKEYYN